MGSFVPEDRHLIGHTISPNVSVRDNPDLFHFGKAPPKFKAAKTRDVANPKVYRQRIDPHEASTNVFSYGTTDGLHKSNYYDSSDSEASWVISPAIKLTPPHFSANGIGKRPLESSGASSPLPKSDYEDQQQNGYAEVILNNESDVPVEIEVTEYPSSKISVTSDHSEEPPMQEVSQPIPVTQKSLVVDDSSGSDPHYAEIIRHSDLRNSEDLAVEPIEEILRDAWREANEYEGAEELTSDEERQGFTTSRTSSLESSEVVCATTIPMVNPADKSKKDNCVKF